MNIAIASEGKTKESEISERGARAPYYLIFKDGKLLKSIQNPFQSGGGGAGFAVPSMLADEKVEFVVGRHFGDNMTGALESHHIQWKIVEPITVEKALKDL